MSKNKRKITPKNSNTPNRIGPFSSPVFLTYKTEKVSNTTKKTVKEVKSKVMEWLDMILKWKKNSEIKTKTNKKVPANNK